MIDKIVDSLGCSIQEAREIYKSDCQVDKMKKLSEIESDFTPEQRKNAKKMRITGTKEVKKKPKSTKASGSQQKRVTYKADSTKESLIASLYNFLQACDIECSNITVANPGRLITFDVAGDKFDLTLIKKSKGKGKQWQAV